MKLTTMSLFLLIILVTTFTLALYLITRTDYNSNIPPSKPIINNPYLSISSDLNKAQNILETFPYKKYVATEDYSNAKNIRHHARCLDSLYHDEMNNRQVLSIALTDSLFSIKQNSYEQFNGDSIIQLMQWVDNFKYHQLEDREEDQILFQSVYEYWMNFISNKLSEYSSGNEKLKYDFKFQFLAAKCSEARFPVSVKVTAVEKVFENIISNRWTHLLNASYNGTSIIQRITFSALLLFTVVAYILTIIMIIRKIKRLKKW